MLTVVLTIAGMALVMVAMALGVMVSGRRLRGSCGGVGGAACVCKREGIEPGECPKKSGEQQQGARDGRSLNVLQD